MSDIVTLTEAEREQRDQAVRDDLKKNLEQSYNRSGPALGH